MIPPQKAQDPGPGAICEHYPYRFAQRIGRADSAQYTQRSLSHELSDISFTDGDGVMSGDLRAEEVAIARILDHLLAVALQQRPKPEDCCLREVHLDGGTAGRAVSEGWR